MACVRINDGERCHKPVDEYITTDLAHDEGFFVEVALCEQCYQELKTIRRALAKAKDLGALAYFGRG